MSNLYLRVDMLFATRRFQQFGVVAHGPRDLRQLEQLKQHLSENKAGKKFFEKKN